MSGVLNDPCLVLNRNWQPITFLPVQTVIVTVMRDMASILDAQDYLLLTFEEWIELGRETGRSIQTPHRSIAAPEVIVLKQYGERPPRRIVFNRPNLFARDAFTCQYSRRRSPGARSHRRARAAAFARWCDRLGELRRGLRGLQRAQGRPDAAGGRHEAPCAAGPSRREAAPPPASRRDAALLGSLPREGARGQLREPGARERPPALHSPRRFRTRAGS